MLTVKEAADRIDVHPNTVRTWTGDFGSHLSDQATPPEGETRYFTEEDLVTLWTIKVLRAEGKSTHEIDQELQAGRRMEPIAPEEPEEEGEPAAGARAQDAAALALELVKGQVDALQNERDYLRGELQEERTARLDAEKRATRAETELELLRGQSSPESPGAGASVGQEGRETAEPAPPWWAFWRK